MRPYALSAPLLERAESYATAQAAAEAVLYAAGALVLVGLVWLRVGPRVQQWIEGLRWVPARARGLLAGAVVFAAVDLALAAPRAVSFAVELAHERVRYGWLDWGLERLAEGVAAAVIGAALTAALGALWRRAGPRYWLWLCAIAAAPAALIVVWGPWLLVSALLPAEPLATARPDLAASLAPILGADGVAHTFVYEGTTLTGFLVGSWPTYRLLVPTTALDTLSLPELEFLLGHEWGHRLRHDPARIGALMLTFAALAAYLGAAAVARLGPRTGARPGEASSLPLLAAVAWIAWTLWLPVHVGFRRSTERGADALAVQLASEVRPDAATHANSALQRLGEANLKDPTPNPLAVFWFAPHPPIGHRIRDLSGGPLDHAVGRRAERVAMKFSTTEVPTVDATDHAAAQAAIDGRRPCVLRGLARDWDRSIWSLAAIRERYGDTELRVNTPSEDLFSEDPDRHRIALNAYRGSKVRLGEYLDQLGSSARKAYLEAIGIQTRLADLWPSVRIPPEVPQQQLLTSTLWIGPAGTTTPLHYDAPHNLIVMLEGRKRFTLCAPAQVVNLYPVWFWSRQYPLSSSVNVRAPDLKRFPRFANAEAHSLEVEAGDALFLPGCWWHEVSNLAPSMSVNFWWNPRASDFTDPAFAMLFLRGTASMVTGSIARKVSGSDGSSTSPEEA